MSGHGRWLSQVVQQQGSEGDEVLLATAAAAGLAGCVELNVVGTSSCQLDNKFSEWL